MGTFFLSLFHFIDTAKIFGVIIGINKMQLLLVVITLFIVVN